MRADAQGWGCPGVKDGCPGLREGCPGVKGGSPGLAGRCPGARGGGGRSGRLRSPGRGTLSRSPFRPLLAAIFSPPPPPPCPRHLGAPDWWRGRKCGPPSRRAARWEMQSVMPVVLMTWKRCSHHGITGLGLGATLEPIQPHPLPWVVEPSTRSGCSQPRPPPKGLSSPGTAAPRRGGVPTLEGFKAAWTCHLRTRASAGIAVLGDSMTLEAFSSPNYSMVL